MRAIRPRAVDLQLLRLSPEEGFVWSRLEGPTTLPALVALTGLDEGRVVAVVRRLAEAGAVAIEGDDAPAAEAFRPPAPSFSGIDELEAIGDGMIVTLEVAAATDPGHVRANNEDSFVVAVGNGAPVDTRAPHTKVPIDDGGVLLAVADGMGGASAGEVASAIVVDTLRLALAQRDPSGDPAEALHDAVVAANRHVSEAALEPGREGMGATLIALLISGGAAYSAEVGDSRFYVLRAGALAQVSKDQTYIAALVQQGMMTPAEAKTSRARHVVLQACGRLPELDVAQRRLDLRAGDVLLLCSDGLSSQVDDARIARILMENMGSLREACAKLVAAANAQGGEDNVTVVLARVGSEAATGTEPIGDSVIVLRELQLES